MDPDDQLARATASIVQARSIVDEAKDLVLANARNPVPRSQLDRLSTEIRLLENRAQHLYGIVQKVPIAYGSR